MLNIDDYFNEVGSGVNVCIEKHYDAERYINYLEENFQSKLNAIILIRSSFLDSRDYERLSAYLSIGLFTSFDPKQRMALFSFLFDIDHELKGQLLRRRFRKYHIDNEIFSNDSGLYDLIRTKKSGALDLELIDTESLNNINGSEIFSKGKYFYKTDPYLHTSIFPICKQLFVDAPIYIRLEPTIQYDEQPLQRLCESILVPANPNWWKHLGLYPRQKQGCAYMLQDQECSKDTLAEFWEYRVRGIRKLEVVAKRNNDGNLTMMIEELSQRQDGTGLLIGRCIHLDTDDEFGTDFYESVVNHLDLAINVYEDGAARERLSERLSDGDVVVDATYRTHILRIETIPLSSILLFAKLFFISRILVDQWLENQFFRSSE